MRRQAAGFTLMEVMIALAILALALAAAIGAAGQGARTAAALTEKTHAQWVAANVIADLRLRQQWPAPGRKEGRAALMGRQWHWEMQVKETDDPALRRVEVAVFADGAKAPATTLLGFLGGGS